MKDVINKPLHTNYGPAIQKKFQDGEQHDQTVSLQFMHSTSMDYFCCRLSYRYRMVHMTFGGTINIICQNKNQVGLYQGEELLLKTDSDPKLNAF
jgi:hypothetical protein